MRRPSISSRSRAVLRALVALALPALCFPALLTAQATPPRLDAVMSASDVRETGISRLSAAERAALERWLGRYTTVVATGARSTPPQERSATSERASRDEQGERRRAVVRAPRLRQLAWGDYAEVKSILNGGGFIVLADGSMWEVWVGDQSNSIVWEVGDVIRVLEAPAPPEEHYIFKFENGRARSLVTVRYAGMVRAEAVEIGRPTKSDTVPRDYGSAGASRSPTVFAPSAAYETVYEPVYGAYYYLPQWNARRGNVNRAKRLDERAVAPTERTIGVRPSTGAAASRSGASTPAASRTTSPSTSAPRRTTGLAPVPGMTAAPKP